MTVSSRTALARHNSLPPIVHRTMASSQPMGALALFERPASIRKARWRERQRRGVIVAAVEVSAVGLELLIATHWLAEADAADPVAIGRAISALLEASGQR